MTGECRACGAELSAEDMTGLRPFDCPGCGMLCRSVSLQSAFEAELAENKRTLKPFTPKPAVKAKIKTPASEIVLDEFEPPEAVLTCPKCKVGILRQKKGKYGEFWGCSLYPSCGYTQPSGERG